MSHMEQAYGFTPTHTEHNIISYSAYQIGENVDREKLKITKFIMWRTQRTDAVFLKRTTAFSSH